jgi:hypothetical protein
VSPRRNRPRRLGPEPPDSRLGGLDEERVRRGVESVQTWRDGEWMVRSIPGEASTKGYRCPGCEQEVRAGVPHVVAWPADGRCDLSDRRHWHAGCWQARDRRAPGVQRARNAPRYG